MSERLLEAVDLQQRDEASSTVLASHLRTSHSSSTTLTPPSHADTRIAKHKELFFSSFWSRTKATDEKGQRTKCRKTAAEAGPC